MGGLHDLIRTPSNSGAYRRLYRSLHNHEGPKMTDLIEDIAGFVAVSTFIATFAVWAGYLAEKV